MRGSNRTRKSETVVAVALIAVTTLAACSSSEKARTTTSVAASSTTVPGTPEILRFTGAVTGVLTSAHDGLQRSDTLCTNGIYNIVGPVLLEDYKLEMRVPAGNDHSPVDVTLSQLVGPGETPPQYFVTVPGKANVNVNKDGRSGTIDAELKPLQGADTNVHVSGEWRCLGS